MKALQRKDLLEEWLLKSFTLGKKLQDEAIGKMAKRVYILF